MTCFTNIIGIHRTCNPIAPSSGLYLQDLPGITLSVANSAVDNETMSGVKLIEEVIEFSVNAILAQIRNQLADKLKVNSIIQNDTIGFDQDNLIVVPAEIDKYKGIKIRISQYPFLEFYINKLGLKLSQDIETQIKVFDLMSDTELDSFDITTAGKQRIYTQVNKGYQTNKQKLHLFIGVDSSVSNTYQTNITPSGCYSCNDGGYSNRYLQITGGQISQSAQKIDSNITSNSGTSGLSIDYSLNCSLEPFLCTMANQIAWPLLHKVGSELMKQVKYSRRQNSVVNVDNGNNEELQVMFENEYMASMSGILSNIKIPNDICFECNSKIRKTVAIP